MTDLGLVTYNLSRTLAFKALILFKYIIASVRYRCKLIDQKYFTDTPVTITIAIHDSSTYARGSFAGIAVSNLFWFKRSVDVVKH
ncbi:MAG: hypothetical protein NVS1B7_4360 [Candidatus Saccharimonadales bacterium]